jgi:hypothetical protein
VAAAELRAMIDRHGPEIATAAAGGAPEGHA